MRSARPDPLARLGRAVWRLLTSVNFAVAQIIVLSLLAIVGMTIRQLPGFAFRSASDCAAAMADSGIGITFYLPPRRIWARLSPAGDLAIVARSDRYLDVEREFGRLLDDLVAARRLA